MLLRIHKKEDEKIISSQIFGHNIIFSDSSGTAIKSYKLEYSSLPNFIEFQSVSRNNIHEKITQFWLAEKGVQFFCNTSAKL